MLAPFWAFQGSQGGSPTSTIGRVNPSIPRTFKSRICLLLSPPRSNRIIRATVGLTRGDTAGGTRPRLLGAVLCMGKPVAPLLVLSACVCVCVCVFVSSRVFVCVNCCSLTLDMYVCVRQPVLSVSFHPPLCECVSVGVMSDAISAGSSCE